MGYLAKHSVGRCGEGSPNSFLRIGRRISKNRLKATQASLSIDVVNKAVNKALLLTGATSGIGTFLANHYAHKDYRLFLHGRDRKRLQRLGRELKSAEPILLEADLASLRAVEAMFRIVSSETRVLDLLINNAFGKLEDPLVKADPNAVSEFFQVSLAGTAIVTQKCVPFLKKAPSPQIINIVADWGFPMHNIMTGPSLYIAAKYGTHGLGAALQVELAKFGIRTTNICPGVVAADTGFEEKYEVFVKRHGTKAIHPEAIAGAIDFVLAQRSSHVRSIVLSPRDPEYNGL